MAPIRFALHCADCHALAITDAETLRGTDGVAAGAVPHERPGVVRTYLRGQLADLVRTERPTSFITTWSTV
jgi:hypothetical protein